MIHCRLQGCQWNLNVDGRECCTMWRGLCSHTATYTCATVLGMTLGMLLHLFGGNSSYLMGVNNNYCDTQMSELMLSLKTMPDI